MLEFGRDDTQNSLFTCDPGLGKEDRFSQA